MTPRRRLVAAGLGICCGVPAAGAQTAPEWRYIEEIRIGSEGEGPAGFSDIRGIVVDRKGNLWVLEFSTQDIRVFDPAGRHLRTIGRKGHGPGEFEAANGMALAPDGRIWVADPLNSRFTVFDEEGKFVRQQLAPSNGYGFLWAGGIDGRGRIWDQIYTTDPKNPQARMKRMRRAPLDWSRVDTLDLPSCREPGENTEELAFRFPRGFMGVPFHPGPVTAVDYRSETEWCANTSAVYELVRIGIERHDTLARISGPQDRIPVTDAERDSVIANIKQEMKKGLGEASLDWSRIPRYKPIVRSLFTDDAGHVWVRRTTREPGSATFDIYTAEGRLLARLQVPHPLSDFRSPVIHGKVAWFVAQEEGEVPYVVRGRIGPP
jgi:6-bladed beta-propeller protein